MVFKRTSRGNTIILLSATLITLGIVGIAEWTSVLLYAGLGLFLYYYVSKLVLQVKTRALDRLVVTREYSSRVDEGAEVNVTLSMDNGTVIRVNAEVLDEYPRLFRLRSGSNTAAFTIPSRGYSRMTYSIAPTSVGSNSFGSLRIITRDLAGLFFYERLVDTPDAIAVTPRGDEIRRGALAAVAVTAYGGNVTSRNKGEGMDFADIRRYEPGDPFKRIEWSSTARTRQLMVRETQAETQLNVMILLDTTETMAYGEAGRTKLDYCARSVASLVGYLSARGDFLGLTLISGASQSEVIPLAKGTIQSTRIMQRLGALKVSSSSAQELGDAVRRSLALGRVKGRTLFFVITDLESEVDLASLKQLVAMKHEVVVISPYTALFEAHGLEGLDRMIYSITVSHQWRTRQNVLREAAKLGIPVLDVGPDDLFPKLVARVEELRRMGGS